MAHKVVVYSTKTCVYCRLAKEYFKQKGVKYTEYDVGEDQSRAEEMVEKSGQMGVPVIDIDGEIIVGFNKPAVEKALA
ncbi:glutathione S-transferase N-terminal domain-containing protein [Candidatus Micrarchaeota archaeon]|nr:glutathione S-transferase N-terminal domain-containing protein [Candidatus Micrarchaeota archaeon]